MASLSCLPCYHEEGTRQDLDLGVGTLRSETLTVALPFGGFQITDRRIWYLNQGIPSKLVQTRLRALLQI